MPNKHKYDLANRTMAFASDVRSLLRKIPRSVQNHEDGRQLLRSSGSVGANYMEADEAVSKADFIYRIKVCKKEAKESLYWLKLLYINNTNDLLKERYNYLMQEADELVRIFSTICIKSSQR